MSDSSKRTVRVLVTICWASAGWGFGFGLGAPLASLWLSSAGFGTTFVGANTAVYYLGIAVAAPAVPWLMRRWGSRCPALGMMLSGVTVALFPFAQGWSWFALRAANGLAGAMSLIPMETLINQESPSSQRARNFGFYAFSLALGWALGNFVGLEMFGSMPRTAFALGGLISMLTGVAYRLAMPAPREQTAEIVRHTSLELRRHALSYGSAWSQGFLEGGMVGLLPLYLLSVGISEETAGWMLSGIMIGVILFQVPVAWLADRFGRTTVLLTCYGLAMATLCVAPHVVTHAWLTVCLFLVGACSGAFYPLGLAVLGERMQAAALPRASAWYLSINCMGSLTGPILTGAAMEAFGNQAMFFAGLGAVVSALIVWLLARRGAAAASSPVADAAAQAEAA